MTVPREIATGRRIAAQGHILEALVEDDGPLTGMPDRFEKRFGLAHDELRA